MTKKIILLSLALGTMLWANSPQSSYLDRERASSMQKMKHSRHERQHGNVEKKMRDAKAMRRTFGTASEYRNTKRKHHKTRSRRGQHKSVARGRSYSSQRYNDYSYDNDRRYEHHRARGSRHYRNSWYLAYRYERASFYDNEGFYYGYFDRRGYTFEGEFYRYDRYYTYGDRLRGKGLFIRRYFRPIVEHYGYNEYEENYSRW